MPASTGPHLGVLAFGDSITNGGGELQWGVALQSWAMWTARGLGLPYTGYAVDGADAAHLLVEQIPAFRARAADPDGPYDLGCLYIGVNDVRAPSWDGPVFAARHGDALAFLHERCARVVCLTPPLDLGRPPAGPEKVAALRDAVRANAAAQGALIVSLEGFGARNHVMVDRVHPTAFGQVAIARRVLAALAADGMDVRVDPARLIAPGGRSRARALRGDWTYAYRDFKQRLRELLGS
ncbi:MAG TPA: GDSL-type esterase/lipase family protein [Solirubrobacteraceae bacterium]|jgi:lysophospholipase L1-like esterase